jgi:hypothetical protein
VKDAMTATPVPADTAEATGRMTRREVVQALSGLMLGMFVSILASTVVASSGTARSA